MKEVPNCDLVTERVALGEPLGMLEQHVATCESCAKLALVPSQIATATERPDPGLGFSARMTIGAQHKLAVRRRRRIAGTAAASMCAAAIGVFVATRSPSGPETAPGVTNADKKPQPEIITDAELAGLVHLADTDRAMRVSAPWGRIQKPLAPYIKLVKGVTP